MQAKIINYTYKYALEELTMASSPLTNGESTTGSRMASHTIEN